MHQVQEGLGHLQVLSFTVGSLHPNAPRGWQRLILYVLYLFWRRFGYGLFWFVFCSWGTAFASWFLHLFLWYGGQYGFLAH